MKAKRGALLLVLVAAAGCGPELSSKARRDPYPECAFIRQWLSEHTGDPSKLEVVDWVDRKRQTYKKGQSPILGEGTFVYVTVRYRGATRRGGLATEQRSFVFRATDGKLAQTTIMPDYTDPGEVARYP